MAYGQYSRTPRPTRGRRTYPKRSTASSYRKVVKPTRQALPALQRQITTLKRQVKPLTQNKLFYNNQGQMTLGNITGTGYSVVNMSSTGSWNRVFGTDTDDESSHLFQQKSMKMFWQINGTAEQDLVNYTLFCVSLTKAGATELFNPAAGTLNTLAVMFHYVRATTNTGLGVMLNKKYFNIYYYKTTHTLSSTGYQGDGTPIRRGSYTHNKSIEWKGINQDWRIKTYNPNACGNLYFLVFNNDSTADASPTFDYNILIQGVAV